MDEAFFKQLIFESTVGFAQCELVEDKKGNDVDFIVLNANDAFKTQLGFVEHSIADKRASTITILHGSGNMALLSDVVKAVIDGRSDDIDGYFPKMKKWYRLQVRPYQARRFVLFCFDISKEKSDLRDRENLLLALDEIIFELDEQYCFTRVIARADTQLMLPREKIIGTCVGEIFSPDQAQLFEKAFIKAKTSGNMQTILYKLDIKGETTWFEARIRFDKRPPRGRFIARVGDVTDIERVKDHLKLAKEEMDYFFQVNLDLLCIADTQGRFIKVNPSWGEVLGYDYKTLEQMHFLDFVHPDDLQVTLEAMATLDKQVKILNFVNRYRTASGDYRYIEWRSYPRGNLIYAAARDITEHRLLEEKIQASQDMLRRVLDTIPVRIFWKDKDLRYLGCNQRFALDAGLSSPEEIIGMEDSQLPWRSLAKAYRDDDLYVMTSGKEKRNIVEQIIDASGSRHLLLTSKIPLKNADGSIYGVMGTFEDITAEREIQEALSESQKRYEQLAESSRAVAWEVDDKGRFTYVNSVAKEVLGYRPDEMIDKMYLSDLCPHEAGAATDPACLCNHKMATELINYEHQILAKDNRLIWVMTNGMPVKDDAGRMQSFRGMHIDITHLKQTEDKVRYLSLHDVLTGLKNRRSFEDAQKMIDRADQLPISVIMADVNGLKLMNDAYGHEAGDLLLKSVTNIFLRDRRAHDKVFRVGGDEFVILLPKTTTADAMLIADRLMQAANKERVGALHISLACGWDTKRFESENLEDVVKVADAMMYRGKISQRKQVRHAMISGIMDTLFEHLHSEKEHAEKVAKIACHIGRHMGVDGEDLDALYQSAYYHDIGKTAVDAAIFNKKETLTQRDWLEIKRHPEVSYAILSSSTEYSAAAEHALYHHERYDGKGYPRGLKKDEIPLASRIICCADAYAAMTSERVYRKAMTASAAADEIKKETGRQFDPIVVRAFLKAD